MPLGRHEGLPRGCCKRRGREEGCCERRGPHTGCFVRHRILSFSIPQYARARWLRFQASPSPPTVFLVSRRATGCYERRQGRQAAASAEEKAALSAGEKAALSAAGHLLILTVSFGNRCCGWVNRCCGCLPCPCPTRRSADSTRLNTPGPEGFVSRHRLLRRPCFWFPGERPGRRRAPCLMPGADQHANSLGRNRGEYADL